MQILDMKVSLPTDSLRTGIGANVQEDVRMRELLKDMAQNVAQAYVLRKAFGARVLLGDVAHCACKSVVLVLQNINDWARR